MKQYCIITTGYNHSGKSTFAKRLQLENDALVIYENDAIRTFFKEHMPILYRFGYEEINDKKHKDIKGFMLESLLPYMYKLGLNCILTNCFTYKEYRKKIIDQLISIGYTPILVHCNPPITLLYERLKEVSRYKDPMLYQGKFYGNKKTIHSKETNSAYELMKENLDRMMEIYETPSNDECELYYERTTEKESHTVLDSLNTLLSKA